MNKHLIICALILITTFFANSAKCEDNFKLSNTQNNSEADGNKSVTTSLKKFGYGYTGSDGHQEQINQLKKRIETLEKNKPEINKLKKRVRKLEKSDKKQNRRITEVEKSDKEQERRLTEVEKSDKEQDRRIAKLEEVQILLNGKLNKMIADHKEIFSYQHDAWHKNFYAYRINNLIDYHNFLNGRTGNNGNYKCKYLPVFGIDDVELSEFALSQIYFISEKLT
ncbi:MAG: hypothetical protein Q7T50_07190, partial [Candidatus Magasanikbacteria bacterium]|nr:hypothetical protein [Candidatus Magasanikbacteria bacterium]